MKNYTTLAISVLSLIVLSACGAPPSNSDAALKEAAATVDAFMKFTLGSIPGASIDYDAAKELMTPDFAAEFTTPMFIPATYCIQDGPEDVRVTDVSFNEQMNWVEATVVGAYHGGWRDMWKFTVVLVEGGLWMIHAIECI
ncbi:hypothetical protein KKF55_06100 [Patescibacteria group bacterium]|nr:hypothetical protein [Patescibacteria group bacterium]